MNDHNRPPCPLIGADGNIFFLMGIATKTLKKYGLQEQAEEMNNRITKQAENYNEALCILAEYVEPISIENENEEYEI